MPGGTCASAVASGMSQAMWSGARSAATETGANLRSCDAQAVRDRGSMSVSTERLAN